MKHDLLTSAQRRKLADNNRKIQEIRELVGATVQIGPKEELLKGKQGELIGWRFNKNAEIEYAIRLFADDQCLLISEKEFHEKGYTFIG